MNDDLLATELLNDPLTSALVQQILTMKPGERLASERDMCTQFSVSRTALRDRLSYLESIGLLERHTGAGTFVKQLHPQAVSEVLILGLLSSGMTLDSLTSVREALERQAAREAVIADDPVKIAFMAAAVKRLEANDDPQEMYEADVAFHLALIAASNNPALVFFSDVLSGIVSRSVEQREMRILSLTHDKERVLTLHRAIYRAIAAGDAARSMQAVDDHFRWLEEFQEQHPDST
jgi:GntR family transcriptional regulator, transcriptional repressor for pyruvate dehydrogenase complex